MSYDNFSEFITPPPTNSIPKITSFPSKIRLQSIINYRWLVLAVQFTALNCSLFFLNCSLPYKSLNLVINLSIIFNTLIIIPKDTQSKIPFNKLPYYLAYDIGQLTIILLMTGGLKNPFSIFIIIPCIITATVLSGRAIIIICIFTILSIGLLYFYSYPVVSVLDQKNYFSFSNPLYLTGVAFSTISTTIFIVYCVWVINRTTHELNKTLGVTQLALAKEQKIATLGTLATAAAHELGSPLSTIQLVAKEMLSELSSDSPLIEDVNLLISQSVRCQEILIQLSREAKNDFQHVQRILHLSTIIELAVHSYQLPGIVMTIYKNSLDPEPALPATPDLLHGLGNILQNAFQFAKSKVEVTLNWNRKTIEIVIQDDGPGYPESLLPHLGQPYSSPQGVTGSINAGRQGGHLGLGLFIAQTLLSQRQGQVHFSNYAGARCLIRWPQNNYESALEGEKENISFP